MFGVASFEFFSYFGVGVDPEAGEIVRDLLWAEVWCQQMQEHGDSVSGHTGCLCQAEDFLDSNRKYGWAIGGVFESNLAATGHFDAFGGFAFDGLQLGVIKVSLKGMEPGCCAEFFE